MAHELRQEHWRTVSINSDVDAVCRAQGQDGWIVSCIYPHKDYNNQSWIVFHRPIPPDHYAIHMKVVWAGDPFECESEPFHLEGIAKPRVEGEPDKFGYRIFSARPHYADKK